MEKDILYDRMVGFMKESMWMPKDKDMEFSYGPIIRSMKGFGRTEICMDRGE